MDGSDGIDRIVRRGLGRVLTLVESAVSRSQFIPLKRNICRVFYEEISQQLRHAVGDGKEQASQNGNHGEGGGA